MTDGTTEVLRSNGGFDKASALGAASLGTVEDWVHRYLAFGYWANPALIDGLRKCPRWWAGPVKVPIKSLRRVVGPEKGMKYEVSQDYWTERTSAMSAAFESIDKYPPLITEYRPDGLSVADGNTRLGAFEIMGLEECWIIVWYNSSSDHERHRRYMRDQGWL